MHQKPAVAKEQTTEQATEPAGSKPGFGHLALANMAAQCAEQLSLAATPLVAVLLLGAGAGQVGLINMGQTLPFLLLAIPLGLVADRASRRGLMVAAEALRAVAMLGLLIGVLTGSMSVLALAVLGFIGATSTVAFSVAAPAMVPTLVPRHGLARANRQLELARSLAYAAGPALAGALVAYFGASAAFVLATVLSSAAALLILRIAEPARAPMPARHPMLELREGIAFVWRTDVLRPILLAALVWNLAWFTLQAAYVPFAIRHLGLDAKGVGLTLGCYGAGMVLGALSAGRLIAKLRYGQAVVLGPLFSVVAAACMVLALLTAQPLWAGLSFFLFGAGPIVWTITTTTLRQSVTPLPLLGRVSAVLLTANGGARPLGAAIGAAVGASLGEAACLWLAMAGFVVQALMVMSSALPKLKTLPEAPQL